MDAWYPVAQATETSSSLSQGWQLRQHLKLQPWTRNLPEQLHGKKSFEVANTGPQTSCVWASCLYKAPDVFTCNPGLLPLTCRAGGLSGPSLHILARGKPGYWLTLAS